MNFGTVNSNKKRIKLAEADEFAEKGALSGLSMYYEPPLETLSLDEFERFPIERLRVMSVIEHAMSRGIHGRDLEKKLETTMNKLGSFMRCKTPEEKRRDNISHWVLRLAFSKSEDLRRRFLTFESFLFKYRFQNQTSRQIHAFMSLNKELQGYRPIETSERDLHKDQLQAVYLANNKNQLLNNSTIDPVRQFHAAKWYKVDWTDVTELVSKRKVYVHRGYAFRSNLSLKLTTGEFFEGICFDLITSKTAFKMLPSVNEDERVRIILKTLQNAYIGPDYSKGDCFNRKSFSKEVIDSIAGRSFPLCMRQLHAKLKHAHHLQYHERVQFRLFLKGCGLTLQDSMAYFQQEFCKKSGMTPGEFAKKYSYNIRHTYGQEGKRKDYTPFNCVKIVLGPQPGAGQAHGCPFKTYDSVQLKNVLQRQHLQKLSAVDIDYIVEPLIKKDYQVACRRHFEKCHPGAGTENIGNHPNAWFEESSKYFSELDKKGDGSNDENAN